MVSGDHDLKYKKPARVGSSEESSPSTEKKNTDTPQNEKTVVNTGNDGAVMKKPSGRSKETKEKKPKKPKKTNENDEDEDPSDPHHRPLGSDGRDDDDDYEEGPGDLSGLEDLLAYKDAKLGGAHKKPAAKGAKPSRNKPSGRGGGKKKDEDPAPSSM